METAYHLLPQGETLQPLPAGTELYTRYEDATHVAKEIWLPPSVYEVDAEGYALSETRETWTAGRNLRLVTTYALIPASRLKRRKWKGLVHGTATSYANYTCRCARCTGANSLSARLGKKGIAERGSWKHGVHGYLEYGCRCPTCKDAYRARPSDLTPLAAWYEDDDPYRRLTEDSEGLAEWAYFFHPYKPYEKPRGIVYATREPGCTFSIGEETTVGHARVREKVEWPLEEPFSSMAFMAQEDVRKAVATGRLPWARLPKVSPEEAAEVMASYREAEPVPPNAERLRAVRLAITNELRAYGEANNGLIPETTGVLYRRLYKRANRFGLDWKRLCADAGLRRRPRGRKPNPRTLRAQDISGFLLPITF